MTSAATKTHAKTHAKQDAKKPDPKKPDSKPPKAMQLKWKPFKLNVKYNYEHLYGMGSLAPASRGGEGGGGASYAPYEPSP